jgi:ATP-dependent DNA ligase
MLAEKYDRRYTQSWTPEGKCIYQPKVDGFRCRADVNIKRAGGTKLYSSTGLELRATPSVLQALREIARHTGIHEMVLDGELHIPGSTFYEAQSLIKRSAPAAQESIVKYTVFDFISVGGTSAGNQTQRLKMLFDMFMYFADYYHTDAWCTQQVQRLPHRYDNTDGETISERVSYYVERGFEGAILRNPGGLYEATAPKKSRNILKIKNTETAWYRICGLYELIGIDGELKDTCGAFACCGVEDLPVFKVGTGPVFTKEGRLNFWHSRQPKRVKVKYQELTPRGVPRFPVAMEVKYD